MVLVDHYNVVKIDGLDLAEEHYKFHVYNLAQMMSMTTNFSEGMIDHLAKRDNFVEEMEVFKEEFWSMMELINKHQSQ
jgi:hypothetical protein